MMERKETSEIDVKRKSEAIFARRLMIVVSVILFFAFVYFIRHLFIYLTFAVLLAYLAAAPTDFIRSRTKMGRQMSILAVLFLFLLGLLGLGLLLIPTLSAEFTLFIASLPETLGKIEVFINEILTRFGTGQTGTWSLQGWIDQVFKYLEGNLPQVVGQVFTRGVGFVNSVGGFLFGLIIVPISAYYFLKDSRIFRQSALKLVGADVRPIVSEALDKINISLGGYVRGQILLCLVYGMLAALGLAILGVKYPLFLGAFVGLTGLIPIVGPIIGFIPAVVLGLSESPWLALKVVVLLAVIRVLDDYFIAPRIMGHSMKLHPLTVIIAMMIGAHVAGIVGMLLALPITAVLKVIVEIYLGKNGGAEEAAAAAE
ncbi:MAG: AI-2E family transporter [bacterium]